MTLLLAILLQSASVPPRDIVVTGVRLDATAAALEQCLARHCPPDEDSRATLAHAENQFVAGDYDAARRTLRGSINRNKRFAGRYPVPISDVMRADARMNLHLGESRLYRIGQVQALLALKAGLPATDGRVLAQRVEVADAQARLGQIQEAPTAYRTVADDASKVGSRTVEAYARLRRVVLLTAISNANAGYEPDLREAVRWFGDKPDLAPFRMVAELMAAQHDAYKADPGLLRVERYSLTAFWIKDATGSRIPAREARSRVQMIDLTATRRRH